MSTGLLVLDQESGRHGRSQFRPSWTISQFRYFSLMILPRLVLAVHSSVAGCPERDQILLGVISQLAAGRYIVDFESLSASGTSAAPAVPLQHLASELIVGVVPSPHSTPQQ